MRWGYPRQVIKAERDREKAPVPVRAPYHQLEGVFHHQIGALQLRRPRVYECASEPMTMATSASGRKLKAEEPQLTIVVDSSENNERTNERTNEETDL
jgi:hypothetical protein